MTHPAGLPGARVGPYSVTIGGGITVNTRTDIEHLSPKTAQNLLSRSCTHRVDRTNHFRTCDQLGGQRIADELSVGVWRQPPGMDIDSTNQRLRMVS